jgi:hypothetical protein
MNKWKRKTRIVTSNYKKQLYKLKINLIFKKERAEVQRSIPKSTVLQKLAQMSLKRTSTRSLWAIKKR